MSGLEFTEDAARQLERLYLTRDVVAQRAETIRRLALSRGERVLDVGCGPGFLCESAAEIVGNDGAIIGIDISSDLIALCRRRSPPTWLSYVVGDATQVAQPDASFDAVVCVQVAEYIPNGTMTPTARAWQVSSGISWRARMSFRSKTLRRGTTSSPS